MTDYVPLDREMWARGVKIVHEFGPCALCPPDGDCPAWWTAVRCLARRPAPAPVELYEPLDPPRPRKSAPEHASGAAPPPRPSIWRRVNHVTGSDEFMWGVVCTLFTAITVTAAVVVSLTP